MSDTWVRCIAYRGITACPAAAPAVYEWRRGPATVRLPLCAAHADDLLPILGPPTRVAPGAGQSIT